ncbi:hypothetical protein [Propioniferax innocua]|uniref:Lipoprotein n=1 Tax=Propioniferax innocua TaxID=1753 RepID=A0A542ZRP9_9ACTN|nr:hypothetical protein [Propioniferax innocua]TQL63034.1 hypothetical protein FB460_0834 [Propioniferax innocua]
MRILTRPLFVVAAATTVALTACGTPPIQNHVPPWERLQLGDTATRGSVDLTVHSVDGNAAEVEMCYTKEGKTGGASAAAWWVWTSEGGAYTVRPKQEKQPVYGEGKKDQCHRGWVQYEIPQGAEITHVTFRTNEGTPTEFTWQATPAGYN